MRQSDRVWIIMNKDKIRGLCDGEREREVDKGGGMKCLEKAKWKEHEKEKKRGESVLRKSKEHCTAQTEEM